MKRLLLGGGLLLVGGPTAVSAETTHIIRTDAPRQTILHFGASDAWSMQAIGLWTDTAAQAQVADWLFSMDTDADGQPRGIGLSLWRFNLGAGSSEQGRESQINRSTRTECFLQVKKAQNGEYDLSTATYDWTRQQGQRRFLHMAKERGVPHFLAFLNSPPVYFTQNGLATNTGRGGTLNLRDDSYDDFADFMATAMKGLEEHDGIHFDYLCPVNEPDGHWNWQGPKQEGSPATNREIARLAQATSRAFRQHGLTTEVLVNESSDLRCLLGVYMTDWQRGNTIRTFFSPDSTATYLGDTPLVPRRILGHSYWTNTPVPFMKKIRRELRDTCRKYGISFWQSELCIMSNDEEIGGGGGYDFSMKTALYVARVMHHDLCYADAQSWSWWRACGGDYKDGLIRYYDDRERQRLGSVGNRSEGGEVPRVRDSRLLWAMGNYSRFVRPGAVRYDVNGPEDPYGLMVSAYRNVDGRWVVVAINYSSREQAFGVSFAGHEDAGRRPFGSWHAYRTSDGSGETLKPVSPLALLPPRSITTFCE